MDNRLEALTYKTYGIGSQAILAFHGFGHPKEDWQFLANYISRDFKIIAVDVPGHGDSQFVSVDTLSRPLTKEDWKSLVLQILQNEKIDAFHIVGYSLGGRIGMVTAEMLPSQTRSIHLFSPDGLHKSNSFRFANELKLGRWIFQKLIANVRLVIPVVKFLNRIKIISDVKRKFVLYQLENNDRVAQVKIVWSKLSLLWPNLDTIFQENNFSEPFQVYFGAKDPIILPEYGKPLLKYERENLKIHTLPFGHRTAKPEALEWLIKEKKWPFSSTDY
ncbi:MAG: alpha/beta fold hydrolase [Flavobacteriales bacterium]